MYQVAKRSVIAVGMFVLILGCRGTLAQSDDSEKTTQIDSPNQNSATPVDLNTPTKKGKAGETVILPVPKSSPAIGTGVQVIGAYFFKADPKSQPSAIGVSAGYYTSDTWFVGAGAGLSLDDDRWKLMGGAGYVSANYDFYGIGTGAGERDIAAPIIQTGTAVLVKALRLIADNWYAGAGYRYLDSNVGLRVSVPNAPELEEILRAGTTIVSSGPTLNVQYDSRDLITNPRTGSFIKLDALFADAAVFGSDNSYAHVSLKASHYWPVHKTNTLAGQIALCQATDNAPFFDLCLFGTQSDLRGYTAGRFQDQAMFATQLEYRAHLKERWGAVVFAGVGQVAPSFGDMNSDSLLPSGGFGIRWMAAPKNKVNVRADVAWGKYEDALFYLSVGEAF
ncbi:MAG: BamA/TamA family outer membrane protein [Burkholderiales bacterium]|jgi:hypothetical protein